MNAMKHILQQDNQVSDYIKNVKMNVANRAQELTGLQTSIQQNKDTITNEINQVSKNINDGLVQKKFLRNSTGLDARFNLPDITDFDHKYIEQKQQKEQQMEYLRRKNSETGEP